MENGDGTLRRAYLDSSVVLNYIQSPFEKDQRSGEIIHHDSLSCDIGSVAKDEVQDRRTVRYQIYLDLLTVAEGLELDDVDAIIPIYDFEPRDVELPDEDLNVTKNDISHIKEIQESLYGSEDQEDFENRIFGIREAIRQMDSQERIALMRMDEFNEEYDTSLVDAIDDEICNRKDAAVLAQAVAWRLYYYSNGQGPETVLTLDWGDMINRKESINTAIVRERSTGSKINISSPDEFLQELND